MIPEAESKKGCVLDTMGTSTAQLRHRELTQEIYNIGDEVAQYIEHIMEAVSDWDAELVDDCLAEFEEIVAEGRDDARAVVSELSGLRHALTSGIRQGTVSARSALHIDLAQPERITATDLERDYPVEDLVVVRELAGALNARTEVWSNTWNRLLTGYWRRPPTWPMIWNHSHCPCFMDVWLMMSAPPPAHGWMPWPTPIRIMPGRCGGQTLRDSSWNVPALMLLCPGLPPSWHASADRFPR